MEGIGAVLCFRSSVLPMSCDLDTVGYRSLGEGAAAFAPPETILVPLLCGGSGLSTSTGSSLSLDISSSARGSGLADGMRIRCLSVEPALRGEESLTGMELRLSRVFFFLFRARLAAGTA
jgi:hypothetical protein